MAHMSKKLREGSPSLTGELSSISTPDQALKAAGISVMLIPTVTEPTPTALRAAVSSRAPAIFPGLCDNWSARQHWNPQTLKRRHGAKEVTALFNLPDEGVLYPEDQESHEQTLSLARFIDVMVTAEPASPCYLAYKRATEIFDPDEYDFNSLFPEDDYDTDTRVWIGSAGTRSMLHSDLKDNLFCQIYGQKSVTLLAWRDSKAVYPFPGNIVNSQVDLTDLDLVKFPRLRNAAFYSTVVNPGDIVFIPRGCWHDIRSITPSISINHWFGKPQSVGKYLRMIAALGPEYWLSTLRDFATHGLLKRKEKTRFFFSPPSTGRRLFDALRWGNFSRENDPNL